jgi:hypothetical protein
MTERKRILLAELTPRIPQPASPSTWNPGDKDLSISLSNGNLTATKTTTHATAWGGVRSSDPIRAGNWYWEVVFSFTGSADLIVGVADENYPRTAQLGENWAPTVGCGGPHKNGDCWGIFGHTMVNIGAVANGGIVCCHFDADAGVFYVKRLADTDWTVVPSGTAINPTQRAFYAMATLFRPSGSTVSMTANFGASAFAGDLPPDSQPLGFYPAPIEHTVYLASDVFNT